MYFIDEIKYPSVIFANSYFYLISFHFKTRVNVLESIR